MNRINKKSVMKLSSFALIAVVGFGSFMSRVNANWLGTDEFVSCGNINKIPARIPQILSMLVNVAMIVIPVLIVIFGVIDLVKGITSQKEEEIKKGQQTLIKRIIIGMVIFLIVLVTKLLINFVADNSETRDSIIGCIDCFINNQC